MKYLIMCLLVAVLAGCDRASDTTSKLDTADTATTAAAEQAVPEAAKVPSGGVNEYGIYKPVRKGRMRDEITTNTGKVINKPVLEFVELTDRIPLVKGTYFAYRFQLWNIPQEEARKPVVKIRKVLVHPEMKLPDGGTSTGWDRVVKNRTSVGTVIGFDGYAFNEDYELVEGDWTFQIWYQDKMLVEQTFTMYWPEEEAGGDTEPAEPSAENSI